MRRTLRIRPTVAVVGAVLGAVVLAGCGAGQVSQTARQVAAVDGANGNAGQIAVRNALFDSEQPAESAVAFPRGASAPLELTIVNTGNAGDELVSVSSPVGDGQITGSRAIPAGQSLTVGGEGAAEVAPPATPSGTATPSARPSASPTTSAGPSASPRATPSGGPETTEAATGGESGATRIVLTGLRDDIRAGLTYEVVLTFRDAGPVRLSVPVAGSTEPREDEKPE